MGDSPVRRNHSSVANTISMDTATKAAAWGLDKPKASCAQSTALVGAATALSANQAADWIISPHAARDSSKFRLSGVMRASSA